MKTKISSTKFENYQEMSQSAKNWKHHCSYRLSNYAFEGKHHIIALPLTVTEKVILCMIPFLLQTLLL
jgi:hypothetical protein